VATVAVSRGKEVEVVANDLGHRNTPIAVSYEDDVENVGTVAINGILSNSKNTILRFVQHLGKSYDESKPVLAESMCKAEDKDGVVNFTPPEGPESGIQAAPLVTKIIQSMWTTAKTRAGDDITEMVLAVPHGCTEEYKQAISAAAKDAGVNVRQFISEPVAVAMAYKIGQDEEKKDETVLVYDLGASKATVTVLSVSSGCYKVLGSVSDSNLGGKVMDEMLVALLVKEFKKKSKMDITNEARAIAKLKAAASGAKHILSARATTTVAVESLFEGADFRGDITKGKFDSTLSKLYRKCADPINKVLELLSLKKEDISTVLLAGGSSITPKIKTTLDLFFEKADFVKASIAPDEVIALGAATQGELLLNVTDDSHLTQKPFRTVSNIAVKVGDAMQVIIPAGTLAPLSQKFDLECADSAQTSVALDLYEVETAEGSTPSVIAQLALYEVNAKAKKSVVATIEVSETGSVTATLRDPNTGKTVTGTVSK